ncbi:glycosyl hydrolase [Clostridia bacterium]|nr:glycosyl hydrolase [Clostridia bacterium]
MKNKFLILSIFAALCLPSCGDEDPDTGSAVKIDETFDKRAASSDAEAYKLFFKTPNTISGDPMPFYNEQEKKFYLFYLSYIPATIADGVVVTKTTNFATFENVSAAINVGRETSDSWDYGIGTGSCIKNGGLYSFFYTGFSSNAYSQVVLKATSSDGKTWTKQPSMRVVAPADFKPSEFRDPCVYFDDTRNTFVMLVGSVRNNRAAIARFASDDLNDWQPIEPIVATTSGNPQTFEIETDTWITECPDIFKMGDKWYLIFSRINGDIHRKTFYRVADNPNGPWKICRSESGHHETFDGLYLYAGKTVSDGANRYLTGWASQGQYANNGELAWGGMLVTHRLVQQPSGKLYPAIPDAIDAKFSKTVEYKNIKKEGNVSGENGNFTVTNGKAVFNRNTTQSLKIEMKIDASQAIKNFGIAFGAYESQQDAFKLVFDTSSDNALGCPSMILMQNGKDLNHTPLVVSADKIFNIKIVAEKAVAVLYVNGTMAFTNRMENMENNPWMIFSDNGTVKFENIRIYKQ